MPQVKTFTLLVFSLVLAGSAFAAPFIATDPETVDFGDVYVGDSPSVDVTVVNTGDAELTIDQIGTDNNVFVPPRMNEWVVLAPEESYVFAVQFAPQEPQAYNGNFIIHSDAINGDGDGNFMVPLSGTGLFSAPVIGLVTDPDPMDFELFTGGTDEGLITVGNDGVNPLNWIAEIELIENGRDAGGRELRQVDGAAGPKRDEPGEVLDEYEIPYPSTTGLAWDPDNELIWGYVNEYPRGQGAIFAFDPAQGEVVAEYNGIEAHHQTLTYWEGLLYVQGNNRAGNTIFVYDLEGNQVERINTPFQLSFRYSTISAWDDQALFFIRGTQTPNGRQGEGYDAVYVYTWPDFDEVARIPDAAETGDRSTCGVLWVPKDKDGQLWVDGSDRLYELNVDDDWNCELVQEFRVAPTVERAGMTHDQHDIWRAVRQWRGGGPIQDHTMLQRIDDGVSEAYWIGIAPEEGEVIAGESQDLLLALNAFGLAEAVYEANIHFLSNDPANPDLVVPVSLTVTGAADINAEWDEDFGYPDVLDWNLAYSELYSGGPYDLIVEVANEGSEALEVNNVSCNNGFFTANPNQFNLAVDESRDVTLTFNADINAPDDYSEDMVFATNDPDEEEYLIHMHADASLPPIGSILPDRIDDELSTGEKADHSLTVTNDGDAPLRFTAEIVLPENMRDAGGRELRRVDGAAGPKRDEPGEVRDEYEIPYTSITGLAWDPDNELIWGYANNYPRDQGAIFAFDPAQGEVVAEYNAESKHSCLTYWEGLLYLQGNTRAGQTIFVYDLEGNQVERINTPFNLTFRHSTIGEWDDQAYFFIRGSQNLNGRWGEGTDAVYVYTWPDFDVVDRIQDAAETRDQSTCGVLWVPKDTDGQLWVDGTNQLYELKVDVDDDWSCELVQDFRVDPTVERAGMTHDKFDIWRAVRNWQWNNPMDDHTMLQRIDDGVAEQYWMIVEPDTGTTPAGESSVVNMHYTVANLLPDTTYLVDMLIESNDPVTPIVTIHLSLTTGVPPLRHFTGFTRTNLIHTVHVTEATFLTQPIPTGWEIGAFTPGGVPAGGAVWNTAADDWMFTVYGDDPNTGEVEGFADGEAFTFMMWDEDADAEFGADITFGNGDQRWVSDGESWVSLNGTRVTEQVIDLNGNEIDGHWNLISLNIRPGEEYWNRDGLPGMREMIAQFRTNPEDDHTNRVFLLKDEEGRFVLPEFDYYGIPVWEVSQGYYVNVNEDVAGSWSGEAIPATEAIPVDAGWNMIPYYPDYDVTCRGPDFQAISSIVDNVIIVKNGWAEFAIPSLPFSNMRAWAPGMGFQIKVNADVSLVYPEEGGLNAVLADNRADASNKHWTAPASTGNNMSVLVTSVSGMMVNEGDEVAAFSSSGRIAGVGTFNADGQAGLGVWGDETITEEVVEGLIEGETFTLKIWDADRGEERRVAVNQGNALTYETNGLAVIDVTASAIVPDVYYLAQNFPNPFNAVTRVGYGLPEASYVTVKVFDVTGRQIATLVDGRQEAGRYVATWKADAAPAGVYFIKMESANFKQSVKTILMK